MVEHTAHSRAQEEIVRQPLTTLRDRFQSFFVGEEVLRTSPEEEAAFEAYSLDRMHRAAVVLCVLVLLADFAAWPFDRFIFRPTAVQLHVAPLWRIVVLVLAVAFGAMHLRPARWFSRSRALIILQSTLIAAVPAYALGLSGYSEVLFSFNGGPGQIAVHGTNNPSQVGQNISNGCVRVPNDVIVQIADQAPLGTPVIIT